MHASARAGALLIFGNVIPALGAELADFFKHGVPLQQLATGCLFGAAADLGAEFFERCLLSVAATKL